MAATPDNEELERRVAKLRAKERGRGREARGVTQIPLAGWRDIALRVIRQIPADRVSLIASGVTFYTILAMFPAMVVGVSIYGLATDPTTITSQLSLLQGLMPPAALDLVASELTRITTSRDQGLGLTAILALAFTLWSANGAVKAMFEAMNVAYDENEKRNFFHFTLSTLAFTFAGIVIVVVVVNVVVFVPIVLEFVGLSGLGQIVAAVLPLLVVLFILLFAISALYRYGPSRNRARWGWLNLGSILATVLVIAMSAGFSFYLANWGNYGATYGSLGAAIGLMMWIYLASFIVIVGAELNAEIEHQTAEDTTIGPEQPLGERRAFVADTVGERS